VKSIPTDYTEYNSDFNKRTKFINKHLKQFRVRWDVFIDNDEIIGSTDLIFESEQDYTFFILRWS
jgi:hypothetical protein